MVPPLVPNSVWRIDDLDSLDALYAGAPGYIYSRDAHPNGDELSGIINKLECAAWGLVTGSGMAALSVAFFAFCKPGDRIVAADQLYGRTFKLLNDLRRFGVIVDQLPVQSMAKAGPCTLMLVETISNPLMQVADLKTLAKIAHDSGARLLVDNTFATPVVRRPLEEGADLVMESLSKMMNGHSDVMLGYLGGRDAALKASVTDLAGTWGFFASPWDCWLARRGLETLPMRMHAAAANAQALAAWLKDRRVHYPGVSNMLAVELADRAAVNRFMKVSDIPFCPSLGHIETTVSYPWSTSHRALSDEAKLKLGITPGLMRVSVGCETYEELKRKFETGLY